MTKEFKQYAANMAVTVRNVPVEAHHSIGMIERYHGLLKRVYTIITEKVPGIEPDLALQMSFKALNDSVGPNGLVLTLLVFGAYPRMAESDAPSPTITQRAVAMRKAMDQVKKNIASRRVNDALNTRNGPFTDFIHGLPLNSPVLVFREGNATQSGAWKGPYKLLSMQGESAIIELSSGPTKFRSTSVKPYFDDGTSDPAGDDQTSPDDDDPGQGPSSNEVIPGQANPIGPIGPSAPSIKRGRGRPRKHSVNVNLCFIMKNLGNTDELFLAENDHSQPSQYTASRQKEINRLLKKNVFKIISHEDVLEDTRIFNSRSVDEIKHPGTDMAYEKSRLMVQAYNDFNKDLVLTQSPTIQRVSQRLIICMTATLQDDHTKLYLRDITQAYVQSTSDLNRDFYIRPPVELVKLLNVPANCILKVMKPLYGVPEAGNH